MAMSRFTTVHLIVNAPSESEETEPQTPPVVDDTETGSEQPEETPVNQPEDTEGEKQEEVPATQTETPEEEKQEEVPATQTETPEEEKQTEKPVAQTDVVKEKKNETLKTTTSIEAPDTGNFTWERSSGNILSISFAVPILIFAVFMFILTIFKIKTAAKTGFCIDKKRKIIASSLAFFLVASCAGGTLASSLFSNQGVDASGEFEFKYWNSGDITLEVTAGSSSTLCEDVYLGIKAKKGIVFESEINRSLALRDQSTGEILNEIPSITSSGSLIEGENSWGIRINYGTEEEIPWEPISQSTIVEQEFDPSSSVQICYGVTTRKDLRPGEYYATVDHDISRYIPETVSVWPDMTIDELYRTNLYEQTSPKNLIVLLMNYNNGYWEMSDEEVEAEWADWIFGTGTIEEGTASVNDYLKEISGGKFYYNPILVGDNTTGVYSFHFDKDYTDEQGLWPSDESVEYDDKYNGFEHNYDMAQALKQLEEKGLDTSGFKAVGINSNDEMHEWAELLWDGPQSLHNPEWYSTDTVLCVFPSYNTENVSLGPVSGSYTDYGFYAHVNDDSTFATIAHELLHTIGTIDIYNFGSYSDIMSDLYAKIPEEYNTIHINPYYKILFGWVDAEVIPRSQKQVTLYPATSEKYNPVIVPTDDPNQYLIIENRQAEGFDHGIMYGESAGVYVWRVDSLGMETIYNHDRKGLQAEKLWAYDEVAPYYYKNRTDVNDNTEIPTGISIDYLSANEDGSITISINTP